MNIKLTSSRTYLASTPTSWYDMGMTTIRILRRCSSKSENIYLFTSLACNVVVRVYDPMSWHCSETCLVFGVSTVRIPLSPLNKHTVRKSRCNKHTTKTCGPAYYDATSASPSLATPQSPPMIGQSRISLKHTSNATLVAG